MLGPLSFLDLLLAPEVSVSPQVSFKTSPSFSLVQVPPCAHEGTKVPRVDRLTHGPEQQGRH